MERSPLVTAALLGCAGMMFLFAVLFVRAMSYGPRGMKRPPATSSVDAGSPARGAPVPKGKAEAKGQGEAAPGGVKAPDVRVKARAEVDAGSAAPPSEAPRSADAGDAQQMEKGEGPKGLDGDKDALVTRLKGQVVPSLLMCMQDRVKRGDSFKGEVAFKVRLKPQEGESGLAAVELVSVDGPDMKKADYDCIWPNFEDVSLKLGEQADAFDGRDEIEAEFGITLSLKGAEE